MNNTKFTTELFKNQLTIEWVQPTIIDGELTISVSIPSEIVKKLDINIRDIDWSVLTPQNVKDEHPDIYSEAVTLKDTYKDMILSLISKNDYSSYDELASSIRKKYNLSLDDWYDSNEVYRQYYLWTLLNNYSITGYVDLSKYTVLNMIDYLDDSAYRISGGDIEYTGHMHYGSPYETASDCGNCDGARCDSCTKIKTPYELYITMNFNELASCLDGVVDTDIIKKIYDDDDGFTSKIIDKYFVKYPSLYELRIARPDLDIFKRMK